MDRLALIVFLLTALGGCKFEGGVAGTPAGDGDGDGDEADANGGSVDATLATIAYRINLGGNSVVATEAPNAGTWSADEGDCSGTPHSLGEAEVNGTVDNDLYTNYRYGQVRCDLPIANGEYRVRFLLAEVWYGGGSCNATSQSRNMGLEIEGEIREHLDLVDETGGCAADPNQTGAAPFERSFDVNVSDGELNLRGRYDPLISAIEVVSI